MHILKTFASLAIAISALLGCASTYRSPGAETAPKGALAVLENNDQMKTIIIEIDGKHRGNGFFNKYELAPGKHTIKVSLYVGIGASGETPTIGLNVAAGETYELLYERKDTGYNTLLWRPYVTNKRTGEHVDFAVPKSSNP